MSWDRTQFNISAFRTDYDDLQTNIFDGVLSFLVQNAAGARSQGIEADGRFLVNNNIELYGSGAYLDYEFTDFPQSQCFFQETPTSVLEGYHFATVLAQECALPLSLVGMLD